jgi:hypothetical protein
MANEEERLQHIDQAKVLLQKLSEIDTSSLARIEDLSQNINFSKAVPYFESMLDVIRQLADRDISRLSTSRLKGIINACKNIEGKIEEVRNFDLNQNTPADVCNNIIDSIINSYDNVVDPFIVPLAFTATQATDYAKLEREAKGYFSNLKDEYDNMMEYISSSKNDIDKALSAIKDQAAQSGVSTNAHIFSQDAVEQRKQAKKWLISTIVISTITFLVGIFFLIMTFVYRPDTVAGVIQYVVSKLIILSALSFGIFWCSRNFKSYKHNEVLSTHRANALKSFRAFVEGSFDERVKDAILLQAAQAAFAVRSTGYDSQENETQSINPIIEVFGKAMTKSQGND